jgi:hypothetical protein
MSKNIARFKVGQKVKVKTLKVPGRVIEKIVFIHEYPRYYMTDGSDWSEEMLEL